MKKQSLKKKLIPTLLATVYTIPALSCAKQPIDAGQAPTQPPAQPVLASQAVQQEVIQLLRQGETDQVTLNIAGRPGTYFRVLYSPTGEEGSYAPVPKGEAVIGENGMGSVAFALKALAKEEVYLKVTTSDTADFASTRVTPKPLILEVAPARIKQRDLIDTVRDKIEDKTVRTPSAVAGVRG
jgi:hypothetical protein